MDKQYKYTLRKTTLGLASVAIAAFLAGQSPIIQAAEAENATNTEALPSEINEAESATNTDMLPAEIHEEEMINVSEVIAPQPVAAQESTELNYSDEEKNIKDYSNSERYKETDPTPGSTVVQNSNTDEGVVKDGFKFDTLNPSNTSPIKTEYGYEIVMHKKTGQRTYTQIFVTDNPRLKYFGGNFLLSCKVNPQPNENDSLEELKLNKNSYGPTSKYFVQESDNYRPEYHNSYGPTSKYFVQESDNYRPEYHNSYGPTSKYFVQESDNYRPEYHAEVGYQGDTLTNTPESLPAKEDTKKNLPVSYELVQGTYKDSSGNVWDNVTIDPETGVVTAVVPEHADIKGGENLFVDVKVHYVDEDGTNSEETIKAQFIARRRYKEEVTKEFTSAKFQV